MSDVESFQTIPEKVRDIRIMLRQGKSAAHIAGVFGWSAAYFAEFSRSHGIELPQDQQAGLATTPMQNLSVRKRPTGRRDNSRPVQLCFNTAAPIAGGILEAARERNTSVSVIVDRIVSGAHALGLWAELLDSDRSSPVASGVPTNNEQR